MGEYQIVKFGYFSLMHEHSLYDKKFNKISKYQYYTASKTDGKKQMFKTEKKYKKAVVCINKSKGER